SMKFAVCLCLWLLVCQVRGSYIPQRMNKTIQNLLKHYKISDDQRYDGKPVFSKKLPINKTETKMVYIGGVLEKYEELIGHMLSELPTPRPQTATDQQHLTSAFTPGVGTNTEAGVGDNVRVELKYLLSKIKELKRHHYEEEGKVAKELFSLKKIQMNDIVTQSKALGNLQWWYDEASTLKKQQQIQRQRRRRRRQARRVKTHPRA
uniref:Interferon gamma-like n=1 Tax=Sphaeramia orbicularis TaxID=375764 RepID=A0A673A1D6_9TELE